MEICILNWDFPPYFFHFPVPFFVSFHLHLDSCFDEYMWQTNSDVKYISTLLHLINADEEVTVAASLILLYELKGFVLPSLNKKVQILNVIINYSSMLTEKILFPS